MFSRHYAGALQYPLTGHQLDITIGCSVPRELQTLERAIPDEATFAPLPSWIVEKYGAAAEVYARGFLDGRNDRPLLPADLEAYFRSEHTRLNPVAPPPDEEEPDEEKES